MIGGIIPSLELLVLISLGRFNYRYRLASCSSYWWFCFHILNQPQIHNNYHLHCKMYADRLCQAE